LKPQFRGVKRRSEIMKANWYRNASEKDQDKVHGTGEVLKFQIMERSPEGVAILLDDKGNLVTKPMSLVRVIVEQAEPEPVKQAVKPVYKKPTPKPIADKQE